MDTDQARALLAANLAKRRALVNLENAAAMASDDPRSTELLETAGDTYAEALATLRNADLEAVPILMPDATLVTHGRGELGPIQDRPGDPEGPLSGPGQGDQGQPPPPEAA